MIRLVHEMIPLAAERNPEALAVQDPYHKLTYQEFHFQIDRLRRIFLSTFKISPKARIIVWLPNSINFLSIHFAVLSAGGISVPCEYHISEANLEKIITNCHPELIVTDRPSYQKMLAWKSIAQGIKFLLMDDQPQDLLSELVLSLPQAILCGENERPSSPSIYPDDVAALMYTTGSTGTPKGVMLTHANILTALKNIGQFIGYTSEDREVIILPLAHNFGLGHAYCNFLNGGAIYIEQGMTRVKRVLNALETFGATGFPGTPMGYGILLDKYQDIFVEKAKNLRFIVINSAPLPPERAAQIVRLFPKSNLMVYYGLTEASRSTFISLSQKGGNFYRSVGRPLGDLELVIQDASGKKLSFGEVGSVLIKGSTVTQGYWNMPDESLQLFRNGYLVTGDLGYQDQEGNLFLVGREKDIINIGGLKVSPVEIEEVLKSYPGILDVGVASLNSDLGEYIVAGIVWDEAKEFSSFECQQYCLTKLEKFKLPEKFIRLEKIPRADTGKIKRQELKSLLEIGMEQHVES